VWGDAKGRAAAFSFRQAGLNKISNMGLTTAQPPAMPLPSFNFESFCVHRATRIPLYPFPVCGCCLQVSRQTGAHADGTALQRLDPVAITIL
jgi:hypothetical protein